MDFEFLIPIFAIGMLFLGLPWLILHYVTKWKQAGSLPAEDEQLLDTMHETARRLEERLNTVERLVAADNPEFRPAAHLTDDPEGNVRAIADNRRT